MSIIEKLFWFITVPGAYIAVACLVYWIFLKITKENDKFGEEDLRVCAGFWVLIVPLWVVFVAPMKLFDALFDMIGGKK
jgi:hypothetical protein